MRTLDQGGTLAIGTAGLSKHTLNTVIPGLGALEQKSEFASGGFYRYGAAAIGTAGFSSTQIGTCTIFQIAGGTAVGGGIAVTKLAHRPHTGWLFLGLRVLPRNTQNA